MSEAVPSDMVATSDRADSNRSYVYYIDNNGFINWLKGPATGPNTSGEKTRDMYKGPFTILIDGDQNKPAKANSGSPKLAVVDFQSKDGIPQTRVYYFDDSMVLNEVCWTGGDSHNNKWYEGSLNTQKYIGSPNTLLTAYVDDSWLKVYFRRADQRELWCAYTVASGEEDPTWTHRAVANKF